MQTIHHTSHEPHMRLYEVMIVEAASSHEGDAFVRRHVQIRGLNTTECEYLTMWHFTIPATNTRKWNQTACDLAKTYTSSYSQVESERSPQRSIHDFTPTSLVVCLLIPRLDLFPQLKIEELDDLNLGCTCARFCDVEARSRISFVRALGIRWDLLTRLS